MYSEEKTVLTEVSYIKYFQRLFTFIIILLCATLLFSSCRLKSPKIKRAYFICFNMLGTLRESAYISADIEEMVSASAKTDSDIFLLTPFEAELSVYGKTLLQNTVYVLSNARLDIAGIKFSATDKSQFINEFILKAKTLSEAEEFNLIILNSSNIFAKAQNGEKNNALALSTLLENVNKNAKEAKIRFGFIAIDGCLGSNYETILKATDCADYFLGSCEIADESGFDYDYFFRRESKTDSADGQIACLLAKGRYNACCEADAMDYFNVTVCDMKKFKLAHEYFDKAVNELSECLLFTEYKQGENPCDNFIMYGGVNLREGISNFVDIKSLFELCALENSETFLSLLNESVIYRKNGMTNQASMGISLYYPYYDTLKMSSQIDSYKKIAPTDNYFSFVKKLAEMENAVLRNEFDMLLTEEIKGVGKYAMPSGTNIFFDYYSIVDDNTIARVRVNRINKKVKTVAVMDTLNNGHNAVNFRFRLEKSD